MHGKAGTTHCIIVGAPVSAETGLGPPRPGTRSALGCSEGSRTNFRTGLYAEHEIRDDVVLGSLAECSMSVRRSDGRGGDGIKALSTANFTRPQPTGASAHFARTRALGGSRTGDPLPWERRSSLPGQWSALAGIWTGGPATPAMTLKQN